MSTIQIALAQLNYKVGDLKQNTQSIIQQCSQVKDHADVIIFSELSVCGYSPEDLMLRPQFLLQVEDALNEIEENLDNWLEDLVIIVGAPLEIDDQLYNCAVTLQKNKERVIYKKQILPNYSVFDEKRYFSTGNQACVVHVKGVNLGITICADLWETFVAKQAKDAGADIILSLNASPFHLAKHANRIEVIQQRVKETQVPIIYVNQTGGQDELYFDGSSFCIDINGEVAFQAGLNPQNTVVSIDHQGLIKHSETHAVIHHDSAFLYSVLVNATRDYILKNGFKGALLGLSGGIDSALVLAIAVDAIGAENVHAVMMPYEYTTEMSKTDAELEAKALGVEYSNLAIHQPVNALMDVLQEQFKETEKDTTEENIQARIRGVLLMALSNKTGKMLLTTGNKSEMSVGYATLYGDMAGGFSPLKDVSKLRVFELAKYRNTISPVIPERVITRPPSAELSPDQVDSDSLPPYEILDEILELYVEKQMSRDEIIEQGFKEADVSRVIYLVDLNEYKRRQSAPGIKISERAYGRERRYPITSGFKS